MSTTLSPPVSPTPVGVPWFRRAPSPRLLRLFTGATATALGLIVVTGGAVRLSDSGLGCPTWPSCTNTAVGSFGDAHASIEFGNRLITVAVTVLIAATTVLAFRTRGRRDLRLLSVALVLGVVADAVIGGLSVRFDLPPALVAVHFLFSMVLLAVGLVLHHRAGSVAGGRAAPVAVWLSSACAAAAGLAMVVGTLVTGTGPHSGGGKHARLGFDLEEISQAHADTAMLLSGLVVALALVARLAPVSRGVRVRAYALVAAVAAQAAIGWSQYFLGLPPGLVLVHMAGATLLWTLAVGTVIAALREAP